MSATPHVLGLDLDGVVADYVAGLRAYVAQHTGRHPNALPEPTAWSFVDSGWFATTREYLDMHAAAVNAGLYRTLPLIPGARDALHRLHDQGTRIAVMTHRFLPDTDPEQVAEDTRHWVETHQLPVDTFQFIDDKRLCTADVYIDDAPHNIASLHGAGRDVLVFDQPYNQQVACGTRVSGWTAAAAAITRHRLVRLGRQLRPAPNVSVANSSVAAGAAVSSGAPRLTRCAGRNQDGSRCHRRGHCPHHTH